MTSPPPISLDRLRAELDVAREWTVAWQGSSATLEAVGDDGERLVLAEFREATPDEQMVIARAPEALRQLLAVVDRASREIRRAQREGFIAQKDYPAEAAMKCAEPVFRAFLAERAGEPVPPDAEAAAVLQRRLLGVRSRRELKNDGEAAARWAAMRSDFLEWQRREDVR